MAALGLILGRVDGSTDLTQMFREVEMWLTLEAVDKLPWLLPRARRVLPRRLLPPVELATETCDCRLWTGFGASGLESLLALPGTLMLIFMIKIQNRWQRTLDVC